MATIRNRYKNGTYPEVAWLSMSERDGELIGACKSH